MKQIKKIVLTGGPCAGKTTALIRINDHFSSLGYKVFTVPEVPTMITQSGWNYMTDNKAFYYEGEKVILELQLALEDRITRMAETCTEPCVIVCDRGAMDISAYIDEPMWQELTQSCGTDNQKIRDRYDAVLHLVSAADGAEQYYTTANNAQRYEKADEAGLAIARMLDKKVINAWNGHPRLRVINNSEDFDSKMDRVIEEISNVLELPHKMKNECKYIVAVTDELPECIENDITQTYLKADPGSVVCLRRRAWKGSYINILISKKKVSDNNEVVTERLVSNSLYESLLQQADPCRNTVRKHRKSFIWKGQFFELDSYSSPIPGLMILETKGMNDHTEVKFPPFLKVVEDVTNNPKYSIFNLALKNCKS